MSRSYCFIFVLFAIGSVLLGPGPSHAQYAQARFENFNVRDGLSQNTSLKVCCKILLGIYGWVHPLGLNRYNGYEFVHAYLHAKEGFNFFSK